jgi:phosphoglycolate phosphatase-like HAD superfamily hydrolase
MILLQLECLKYIPDRIEEPTADRHTGAPTGQGIPIDIVLLPNLLLDTRAYNVRRARGQMYAVGGRAARVACALRRVANDYDGTLGVHLMTKTGNLGRLLLENEYQRWAPPGTRPRPALDFVEVRNGEPRGAIWKAAEDRPLAREPIEEGELSVEDIERMPQAIETIQAARTVYLASLHTPNADALYKLLVRNMRHGARRTLFLDTARTGLRLLKQIATAVEEAPFDRLVIFSRPTRAQQLVGSRARRALERFCRDRNVILVQYPHRKQGKDRPAITCILPGSSDPQPARGIPFAREDVPEYFKAGVILASSLYEAIEDPELPIPQDLREHLISHWRPPDKPADVRRIWREFIKFGILMARAQVSTRRASHDDLVEGLAGLSRRPDLIRAGTEKFRGEHQVFFIRPHGSKEMKVDDVHLNDVAGLAAFRRKQDGLTCADLPLCRDPSCPGQCPKASRSSEVRVAAVLIDLDGTLIDSTEQRRRGLEFALQTLGEHELPPPGTFDTLAEAIRFFGEYVYEPWPIYRELGLGDFRQQWNLPGWYATYLVLTDPANGYLRDAVRSLWRTLASSPSAADVRDALAEAQWPTELTQHYREAMGEHQSEIAEARAAFQRASMRPFKEARDFLLSLKGTAAFELYVVSEGEPETQWMKLQRSGLDEFFDHQHVLTTGDAAEPVRERRRLAEETGKVQGRLTEVLTKLQQCRERLREMGAIWDDIEVELRLAEKPAQSRVGELPAIARRAIGESRDELLDRIAQLDCERRFLKQCREAAKLIDKVLSRMARKGGISFYAAVVRSILRKPLFPLDVLKDFGALIDPREPDTTMKYAMIGDRHSNDITPPLRVLSPETLLTIRLNSAKYALREPVDEQQTDLPTYVASTLAQTKAILLSRETWQAITCTSAPPIFCLPLDLECRDHTPEDLDRPDVRVGIDAVLWGVAMDPRDYPTIHRISFGILWEYLTQCSQDDRQRLLDMLLAPDQEADPWTHIRTRVRVLYAFVRSDYAVRSEVLEGRKALFAQRLLADRRLLDETEDPRELIRAGCWDKDDLIRAIDEALERLGEQTAEGDASA